MSGANQIAEFDVWLAVSAGDRDHQLAVAFPQIRQCGLADTLIGGGLADAQQMTLTLRGEIRAVELRANGKVEPRAGSRNRHRLLPANLGRRTKGRGRSLADSRWPIIAGGWRTNRRADADCIRTSNNPRRDLPGF